MHSSGGYTIRTAAPEQLAGPPMSTPELPFAYKYPRPALTVDLLLATPGPRPRVLLIRRKHEPFAGRWALPGGFVDEGETLETAARRELLEETGVTVAALEQFRTYGDPGRDPRGWTVSVVYLVRVAAEQLRPQAGDDAAEVSWFSLDELPELAFDHARILGDAHRKLTGS
jgi:8-oxo-dGTP diphosphatase